MKYAALALTLLSLACTTLTPPAPAPAPCNAALPLLNATAWMQSSAEYRASATQVYATARRVLDDTTEGGAIAAKPAIVLDLDETAMDNSRFEVQMIRKNQAYDQASWSAWVAAADAAAIPGALDFLNYAHSRGVKIFYVTNRLASEEASTRRNLEKLGFPLDSDEDTLLTRGERPEWASEDKTPRREYVSSRYHLIMLFGDDLNDFVRAYDLSRDERARVVADNAANWGTRWFILPNPLYGSWQRALTGNARGCDQVQKELDALQP